MAADCGRRLEASTALRFTGGGDRLGSPGCLTGESEERETWTAESLRAAWFAEKQFSTGRRPDETSAVDVSGQHP